MTHQGSYGLHDRSQVISEAALQLFSCKHKQYHFSACIATSKVNSLCPSIKKSVTKSFNWTCAIMKSDVLIGCACICAERIWDFRTHAASKPRETNVFEKGRFGASTRWANTTYSHVTMEIRPVCLNLFAYIILWLSSV